MILGKHHLVENLKNLVILIHRLANELAGTVMNVIRVDEITSIYFV
ncbi:hypothetical protein GARC_4644 [Paraglaciecola arctica BSs20135]|uniref:Uncharacterized protein n=1 Tax=Paraglaciecola arctica BSs20135 TaxID=493475 RepID=K6YC99_9ALTE|nr:hypothetical protein GARC_4644 [Paraglaciecola arctica BSs20135]